MLIHFADTMSVLAGTLVEDGGDSAASSSEDPEREAASCSAAAAQSSPPTLTARIMGCAVLPALLTAVAVHYALTPFFGTPRSASGAAAAEAAGDATSACSTSSATPRQHTGESSQ